MTPLAHHPTPAELDERERTAWTAYSGATADRAGKEYERREAEAWAALQDELEQITAERRTLGRGRD